MKPDKRDKMNHQILSRESLQILFNKNNLHLPITIINKGEEEVVVAEPSITVVLVVADFSLEKTEPLHIMEVDTEGAEAFVVVDGMDGMVEEDICEVEGVLKGELAMVLAVRL